MPDLGWLPAWAQLPSKVGVSPCGAADTLSLALALLAPARTRGLIATREMAPYGAPTGLWDWAHRGDVRAAVRLDGLVGTNHTVFRVSLPWRRRDANVHEKAVLVTDCQDAEISSVWVSTLTAEVGVVDFATEGRCAPFFVYWLPYTQSGIGAGFVFAWDSPRPRRRPAALPPPTPIPSTHVEIQARRPFESSAPMGLPATKAETDALLASYRHAAVLTFPEARERPVRMSHALPARWAQTGPVRSAEL